MIVMPTPESERMDALSEAIVRLLKRQDQTESRLTEIEKALDELGVNEG